MGRRKNRETEVFRPDSVIKSFKERISEIDEELLVAAAEVREAYALGDLSENSELDAAKNKEKSLQQEKSEIEGIITALEDGVEKIVPTIRVTNEEDDEIRNNDIPEELHVGIKWYLHSSVGRLPAANLPGILNTGKTIVGQKLKEWMNQHKVVVNNNGDVYLYNDAGVQVKYTQGDKYSIIYFDKNNMRRKIEILNLESVASAV